MSDAPLILHDLIHAPRDNKGVGPRSGPPRSFLSGRQFNFPFRAQSLPYSATNYSRVQCARLPYFARVIEFAYRFDMQDAGLWLFPIISRFAGTVPSVAAVANGLMGEARPMVEGAQDPALGGLAFEASSAADYQRVPLGYIMPFASSTLGLYVVNAAADAATHNIDGWFFVEEIVTAD